METIAYTLLITIVGAALVYAYTNAINQFKNKSKKQRELKRDELGALDEANRLADAGHGFDGERTAAMIAAMHREAVHNRCFQAQLADFLQQREFASRMPRIVPLWSSNASSSSDDGSLEQLRARQRLEEIRDLFQEFLSLQKEAVAKKEAPAVVGPAQQMAGASFKEQEDFFKRVHGDKKPYETLEKRLIALEQVCTGLVQKHNDAAFQQGIQKQREKLGLEKEQEQ